MRRKRRPAFGRRRRPNLSIIPPLARWGFHHESEQGTLGKRRLHAHRARHARKRRGARQIHRRHQGPQSSGSRLRRRNDRFAGSAARADVLGVDIASNLVDAGNRRAKAAGLTNLRFQEGDACDLKDLKDKSFDLVVTIFGAMFAPKPIDVAKSMVRVTKPGGRIVMGNWIPATRPSSRRSSKSAPPIRPHHPKASSARCCGASKRKSSSALRRPASPRARSRARATRTRSISPPRPPRPSTRSAPITDRQ